MTPDDQVRLRAQLKVDEGFRDHLYPDSLGYLTGGYGHLMDPRKGGKIKEWIWEIVLDDDIKDAEQELSAYAWYQVQDSVRQCALANMMFNTDLLHFPMFLVHMGNKDYDGAIAQIENTPWHREVGIRADRIIQLIKTGAWP